MSSEKVTIIALAVCAVVFMSAFTLGMHKAGERTNACKIEAIKNGMKGDEVRKACGQ